MNFSEERDVLTRKQRMRGLQTYTTKRCWFKKVRVPSRLYLQIYEDDRWKNIQIIDEDEAYPG